MNTLVFVVVLQMCVLAHNNKCAECLPFYGASLVMHVFTNRDMDTIYFQSDDERRQWELLQQQKPQKENVWL